MEPGPLALVVDDEPIVQRLVARIFERDGIEVCPAIDGDGALERIRDRTRPIDRALIDATVPPGGAAPVIEALLDLDPRPLVVVTSGKPLDGDLQLLVERIGAVYLPKPFGPQSLLDAVEAARRS